MNPKDLVSAGGVSAQHLAEIEARLAAASCGPWKVYARVRELSALGKEKFPDGLREDVRTVRYIGQTFDHPQLKAPAPIVTVSVSPYFVETHSPDIEPANAEFIAHAPSDVAVLVEAVKALRAALEPFAALGDQLSDDAPDRCAITWGDLRRAAAVLGTPKEGEK